MSKTKTFLVRWSGVAAIAGLLLLFTLVLAGCGEPTAVPTKPPVSEATPTKIAAEPATPTSTPTEPPPTAVPTEPPPTAVPTEPPTPEPVDDTGCITCHTNEESLKALAQEEEEPEVESEGEG